LNFPYYNLFVGGGVAIGYLAADSALVGKPERQQWPNLCLLALAVGAVGSVCFSQMVGVGKAFHHPAFTFLGGTIPAAMALFLSAKLSRLNVAAILDAGALGISAGHAIGRLGCFFGGCCYGKIISFGTFGDHRFPTPLIEAAGEFCIFLYLKKIAARRNLRAGQIAAEWMMLYGGLRFVLEFTRGDIRGNLPFYAFELSPSQLLSFFLALGGLLAFYSISNNHKPILTLNKHGM
jgi:prolipoprotein diacylglyceryltransferase